MSRILYVATSDLHLKTFHVPYLEWLAGEGHIVDIVAEQRGGLHFDCVKHAYSLPFPRTLASFQHLRTLRRLRGIIDGGDYDLIHCHTPIPSALTRIAARKWRKRGGKLLYTAHGFHFYRGGPLRNWLTYYPAEWLLSAMTDAIITINREDFGYVNGKMWHQASFLIPGIGVQATRFQPLTEDARQERRASLGYAADEFLLLYIAEFIPRKNHLFLLHAADNLVRKVPKIRFLFVGTGQILDQVKTEAARRGLDQWVQFLGFRSDVEKFASIVDVGISSSRHEGLGLGLLEQMMCGVPVVASQDKGHREFVQNGLTGFLFPQGNKEAFVQSIMRLHEEPSLRRRMGEAARQKGEEFSLDHSLTEMKKIYAQYLS
jgi:glycosyltransferase EpsD